MQLIGEGILIGVTAVLTSMFGITLCLGGRSNDLGLVVVTDGSSLGILEGDTALTFMEGVTLSGAGRLNYSAGVGMVVPIHRIRVLFLLIIGGRVDLQLPLSVIDLVTSGAFGGGYTFTGEVFFFVPTLEYMGCLGRHRQNYGTFFGIGCRVLAVQNTTIGFIYDFVLNRFRFCGRLRRFLCFHRGFNCFGSCDSRSFGRSDVFNSLDRSFAAATSEHAQHHNNGQEYAEQFLIGFHYFSS